MNGKNCYIIVALLAVIPGEELEKIKNPSTLVDLIYQQEVPKEFAEIFEEDTIVYFGATWCAACPAQKAILKILEKQGYRVKYYDVDTHKVLYNYLRGETQSIPMIVIFVDAKIKKRFNGITSLWKIKKEAKECFISEDSSRKP